MSLSCAYCCKSILFYKGKANYTTKLRDSTKFWLSFLLYNNNKNRRWKFMRLLCILELSEWCPFSCWRWQWPPCKLPSRFQFAKTVHLIQFWRTKISSRRQSLLPMSPTRLLYATIIRCVIENFATMDTTSLWFFFYISFNLFFSNF